MSKKRKWNDDYVRYGFTCMTEKDGTQTPQCILCSTVFTNANLKPSRLNEHFNNRHGGAKSGNDFNTLKIKRGRFDGGGTLPKQGFVPIEKPLLQASYQVAFLCAKKKKPHTVAEELVKPCALEMAKTVLGTEAEKKLRQVPLSNDIICSRIRDMSKDILQQVIADIKASPIKVSLQLDESTDVSFCSQLLVFVRYVKEKEVVEEFLFCEPLTTTTKAIDVFNIVKDFFLKHGMTLDMCGSLCTDGAPAMLGNKSGFAARVKKEVPHVTVTHCVLHRHALAAKTLPEQLKNVLSIVVSAVNFIRGQALNHRLFKVFCDEIGAEHNVLLYHTEVRWLSRGRVLTRVFELHKEIQQFLRQRGSGIAEHFENEKFILSLAYLADIFSHLNELNTSIQGTGMNMITAREKMSAFTNKLPIWINRIGSGNYANFPKLDEVSNAENLLLIVTEMKEHLQVLSQSFQGYFQHGEVSVSQGWMQDPFVFNLDSMDDNDEMKEDLVEMKASNKIKMEFDSMQLDTFWCAQLNTFPQLAERALEVLVPFATTYLCETGFSTLVHIKTKARNRLDASDDMRVAISKKNLVSA